MKNKIVIIGMPGCGKTTISKILEKELNFKLYDVDEYIQDKTSKTISELFEKGEDYFRDIETEACIDLSKKKNILIATGGGVVKRKENIDCFRNESLIIFIDRPVECILKDVDVSKRPLLKDGKEKVLKLYEERYALYKEYADFIVVNDSDLKSTVSKIKEIIRDHMGMIKCQK